MVKAVIAGQMSLAEATTRFERLRRHMDDGQDEVLGTYRGTGPTDREVARNVILWVSTAMQEDSRQAEVLQRLEKEVAHLGKVD